MPNSSIRLSQERLNELPDLTLFAQEIFSRTHEMMENVPISSPVKRAHESFRKAAENDCSDPLVELKRARHELGFALRYYIDGNPNSRIQVQDSEKDAFKIFRDALNKVPDIALD